MIFYDFPLISVCLSYSMLFVTDSVGGISIMEIDIYSLKKGIC